MLWPMLLLLLASLSIAVLGARSAFLRESYYRGIQVWSRWIPIAAVLLFWFLIGSNLFSNVTFFGQSLHVGDFLNHPRLVVLFIAAPILLTSAGSTLALGILVFTAERAISAEIAKPNFAAMMLFSTLTIIIVLGDHMPWLQAKRSRGIARNLRQIVLILIAGGAMLSSLLAIVRIASFSKFINHLMVTNFSTTFLLVCLMILIVGWAAVLLGMSRHFLTALFCLPTLMVFAFVTTWPHSALAIPFAACVALCLAAHDRRLGSIPAYR